MGDFVSLPHDEMRAFTKMESLLQNKISRRIKIRPLDKNGFGYLNEHCANLLRLQRNTHMFIIC